MSLVRTEADRAALANGYFIDERHGNFVIEWIEANCVFSTGKHAGKPFILLDWERQLVHQLFSWRNPSGLRRFKICSCWIPRGSGKTELAAALTLFMLLGDGEANPEIIFAASSLEQARIAYSSTTAFIWSNPDLVKHLWPRDHVKRIEIRRSSDFPSGGYAKIVSGTGKSKQGMRCSFAVLDEVGEHDNRDLYDAVRLSMSKREEPILLTISTAGYDKSRIGYEIFSYSKRILDGDITDDFEFLPIVWEAPIEADHFDINTYLACNPSVGHTVQKEFFQQLITEAKNEPMKENAARTFYLNQWVGNAKIWIPSTWWANCFDSEMKEENFRNAAAVIGVDLSQRHDLTSYQILIEDGGHYYGFPRFWIPKDTALHKEQKDKVAYRSWQQKETNKLYFCDDDKIHQSDVKAQILKDLDYFDVKEIRYDPTGAQLLMEQLEAETGIDVVAVTPTRPSLSPATVEFYNWIKDKKFHHANNDVLNWNAQNAVAREDNFSRVLVEKGKCLQRVDGITATIIAASYFTNYKQDYTGILC